MVARGPDQTVRIQPIIEGERGKEWWQEPARPVLRDVGPDSGPVRVQGWWEGELVFIQPLRIIDGVPDDLRWTATEKSRIDRLVFIYGGKGYLHPLGRIDILKGQQLHLALNHLQLNDRFGQNVLG